jgi:hypothetical protein
VRHLLALLAATAIAVPSVAAQTATAGGQIRPRYEFRDPVSGRSDGFVSMRVRGHVRAVVNDRVRAVIQLQDVRLWGEESGPLSDFSADNLDLHQGYVDLSLGETGNGFVRIGRQELSLGGERLVGAVDWTQQGQSFDGFRAHKRFSQATIEAFGFITDDGPGAGSTVDAWFSGLYVALSPRAAGTLDLFGFYHEVQAVASTDQITLGVRWHGTLSERFHYRLEGAYQVGDRGGEDVSAYLVGARLGSTVANGTGTVTIWFDHLSGDDDPADGQTKVFDTLFATNHKFYGLADLFLNIPAHTGGLGLQDLALKGSYRVRDCLSLAVDLHTFRLATRGSLASRHLADEIDVGATYSYMPGVTFTAGWSLVLDGSALNELGRLTHDMTYGYVSLNTVF